MRRIALLSAAAVFLIPASGWSQQGGQQPASQQDSVAEAARKSREQRKQAGKTGTVFTNDNLPAAGGINTVGEGTSSPTSTSSTTAGSGSASAGKKQSAEAAAPKGDEKAWREKFAKLHHQLEQDQSNLDVMQRELGVLDTQYYNDPMKGMQQGLTREDINNKTADIDKMKARVESDKQAIADAEDQLRASGGNPGWAR